MSKKDYIEFAEYLIKLRNKYKYILPTEDIRIDFIDPICLIFKNDNPNFDELKFKDYIIDRIE
jgi:hypothetical protein